MRRAGDIELASTSTVRCTAVLRGMTMIDWVQWPAMAATLAAAWLVASQRRGRRLAGFATFVVSNVLWVVWAIPAEAYALIVLQIGLFVMNLRGIRKNEASVVAEAR